MILPHPVREILRDFPDLTIEVGGRHAKARHPVTLDFVPLAASPSGSRWQRNLVAQLRRLDRTGRGLIASKGGGR